MQKTSLDCYATDCNTCHKSIGIAPVLMTTNEKSTACENGDPKRMLPKLQLATWLKSRRSRTPSHRLRDGRHCRCQRRRYVGIGVGKAQTVGAKRRFENIAANECPISSTRAFGPARAGGGSPIRQRCPGPIVTPAVTLIVAPKTFATCPDRPVSAAWG
jgi:hypothetical protein